MKNSIFLLLIVLIILSFSKCQKDPPIPPGPHFEFTDFLIIDTTEYLNINFFDPGIDVSLWWSAQFSLDLNEDEQPDLSFDLYERAFLNGGFYQHYRFESMDPSCTVIGTFKPDSVARWNIYDEEEVEHWFTILFDPADSINYDTLLSLEPQHIIELPVLRIGDTLAVDDIYEYVEGVDYLFRNRESDWSAPWFDLTSTTDIVQGVWNSHQTGYVGFKISGQNSNTIGWFKVVIAGNNFRIEKVTYVEY